MRRTSGLSRAVGEAQPEGSDQHTNSKGKEKEEKETTAATVECRCRYQENKRKDRVDVCSSSELECVVQDPNRVMPTNNAAMRCTSEKTRIPTVELTVVKMEDREYEGVLQCPRAMDEEWGMPMQQELFEPVSPCNVAAQLHRDTSAMPLLLKGHSGSYGWRCSTDACLTHSKKNYCINGNCCQYSHLLAPDLVTATVEMIRLRPRRSFPADAVPVEESQYPTFLAERMCRLNLYQSGEAPVCFSSDQTFY